MAVVFFSLVIWSDSFELNMDRWRKHKEKHWRQKKTQKKIGKFARKFTNVTIISGGAWERQEKTTAVYSFTSSETTMFWALVWTLHQFLRFEHLGLLTVIGFLVCCFFFIEHTFVAENSIQQPLKYRLDYEIATWNNQDVMLTVFGILK